MVVIKIIQIAIFTNLEDENSNPKDPNTKRHQNINQNPNKDSFNSALAQNYNILKPPKIPSITPQNHPTTITPQPQPSTESGKNTSMEQNTVLENSEWVSTIQEIPAPPTPPKYGKEKQKLATYQNRYRLKIPQTPPQMLYNIEINKTQTLRTKTRRNKE